MTLLSDAKKARATAQAHASKAESEIRSAYRAWLHHVTPAITGFITSLPSGLHEQGRLNALITHVGNMQRSFAAHAQIVIRQGTQDAAHLGDATAHAAITSLVPAGVSVPIKTARDAAAVNALLASDRTARFLNRLGSDTEFDLRGVLMDAILSGIGPRQAASSIQNVLDSAQSYALMVARTEILGAYRSSQLANFQANSDVVDGWIWNCALDLRSCGFCIGMHGTFHTLDEDMETHPNCACDAIPHTRSWGDILASFGIGGGEDIPDTNPVIPSGESWYYNLSAGDQQSIVGPAKYNALQAGDIQFSDLIGDGGEASLKSLGLDAADYLGGGE